MDKNGKTPPKVVAQKMDAAATKEKGTTFDEVKEKAWQASHKTLSQWQARIEDKVKEKSLGINQHLADLSVLYGEPVPEKIVVSLQYYPSEGSHKGEPINNFVESGRLEEDTADVLYWVSNPGISPSDTPEDIEVTFKNNTDEVVQKILHEIQHRDFQKSGFRELIKASEQQSEVAQILDKLQGLKGTYIEVTRELVTTYLETFGKKGLKVEQEARTGTSTPLVMEVDKEKTGKVLEAVIKADVEEWRNKGKGSGPYTALRQNWERVLRGLPEGFQTTQEAEDVTQKGSDKSYKGTRIYEIAQQLDIGLAERYVVERKQMDIEFVIELYKMVDSELEREGN